MLLAMMAGNLGSMPAAAQDRELSPEMRKALRTACSGDYRRLCSGIRPGDGRIAACFKDNASALSETCRAALAPLVSPAPQAPPPQPAPMQPPPGGGSTG